MVNSLGLKYEVFEELVKQWWNYFYIYGSPDFIFAKNLQQLKAKLKEWNHLIFGRLEHRKSEILREVQWFGKEAKTRKLTEDEKLLKDDLPWSWREVQD